MSEIGTFFRHCPSCGRRFEIRLVSKKLEDVREDQETITQSARVPTMSSQFSGFKPIMVEQSVPITIKVEEFQYAYKCKHCSHEWSEMHTEEHKES